MHLTETSTNYAASPGRCPNRLVVSAGRKKVIAAAVPGEKFTGGGVAMKVDVIQVVLRGDVLCLELNHVLAGREASGGKAAVGANPALECDCLLGVKNCRLQDDRREALRLDNYRKQPWSPVGRGAFCSSAKRSQPDHG